MTRHEDQSDLQSAFERNGFFQIWRNLGGIPSGDGLLWTIRLNRFSRFGLKYCQADCGVLDNEAQAIAFRVWQALDPRISAQLTANNLKQIVLVSRNASDWVQGMQYSGPNTELLYNWHASEGEPNVLYLGRVVSDCWIHCEPVWRTFATRRSLFDLLTRATPPFENWSGSNTVACAALYLALADLLGVPLEDCLPTLERLWTRIRNGGGVPDLTIDQLIAEHYRQRWGMSVNGE